MPYITHTSTHRSFKVKAVPKISEMREREAEIYSYFLGPLEGNVYLGCQHYWKTFFGEKDNDRTKTCYFSIKSANVPVKIDK